MFMNGLSKEDKIEMDYILVILKIEWKSIFNNAPNIFINHLDVTVSTNELHVV